MQERDAPQYIHAAHICSTSTPATQPPGLVNLRCLILDDSKIGDAGLASIRPLLEVWASVLHVVVGELRPASSTSQTLPSPPPPAARPLRRGGSKTDANVPLSALYLCNCALTVIGCVRLGESLPTNRELRTLHLDRNKIGVEGLAVLTRAAAFKQARGHGLLELSLAGCHLGGKSGVAPLSRLLGDTQACLECLDLSHNLLGPDGAGALAGWLAPCQSLCCLRLENVGLGFLWSGPEAESPTEDDTQARDWGQCDH